MILEFLASPRYSTDRVSEEDLFSFLFEYSQALS